MLFVILLIPSIFAITCYDSFSSTENVISICNYCEEANGTICGPARYCNYTIYHSNLTLYIRNVSASNYGDGSIVYNITQVLSGGAKNLSDGTYLGELYCGPRSREDFSFIVGTPTKLGAGYNAGGISIVNGEIVVTNETRYRIPEDINYYTEYWASKLSPSNKTRGKWAIFFILVISSFNKEIRKGYKKIRIRSVK